MVIVDSTVWIDLVNRRETPHTAWLETNALRRPLGLTDLILCEVLQGTRQQSEFDGALARLQLFSIFTTGGEALAIASAKNYRTLRARGVTVRKTIDCVIATFCIEQNHSLLHTDRDFDVFEEHLGLRVVHP